jgi:hypothetical protein
VAGSVLVLGAAGLAAARDSASVFYLTVHPKQCLIKSNAPGVKTVQVVPCSNAAHDLEVYALGHGHWGSRPPSNALAIAGRVCLGAYSRVTGHAMARTSGWEAFWPDPGAESAKYGDKIICSFRTWPAFRALGAGWHVH